MTVSLMRRRFNSCRWALLTTVGLLLASCTAGEDSPAADAEVPTQPQVLEVTMRGQAYALGQDTLRPGRAVFRVANEGETDHDLALIKLPDDVAGVSQWLNSGVSGVQPVYTMADRAPGQQAVFAVDLEAGQYGMLCFVKDDEGVPHYRKGMVADFQVRTIDDAGTEQDPAPPPR